MYDTTAPWNREKHGPESCCVSKVHIAVLCIDHRLIPVGNESLQAPTTRPGMNKSQPTQANKPEWERIPEGRNRQGED